MEKYIGTKIVEAVPAYRIDGKIYEKDGPIPRTMSVREDGFKVIYADGHKSWLPKDVFEDSYHKLNGLTFGMALEALKCGNKVARRGWNGRGIFIEMQVPDANSKMTSPYIFIDTTGLQTDNPDAPKSRVPWLASQTDMLAEDWTIIE